ncbi:DUF4286 family protein [Saccharomonospora sp.]|uniref:DUF4286 family protein n=1 Tax=Saccharomonospora sp. TaxID=33913 RepID=UPI0026180EEF|nr:DUF4286 family protein [Saccharomonospora sp.]
MNYLFLVQSDPLPGREDEYNDWYTNQHLHDVVAVPGFVSAQRFRLADYQREGNPEPAYRYIALYEIEGPLEEALSALDEARAVGMFVSPAMDPDRISHTFIPITKRITRDDVVRPADDGDSSQPAS